MRMVCFDSEIMLIKQLNVEFENLCRCGLKICLTFVLDFVQDTRLSIDTRSKLYNEIVKHFFLLIFSLMMSGIITSGNSWSPEY